jgi:hypothetical protein
MRPWSERQTLPAGCSRPAASTANTRLALVRRVKNVGICVTGRQLCHVAAVGAAISQTQEWEATCSSKHVDSGAAEMGSTHRRVKTLQY